MEYSKMQKLVIARVKRGYTATESAKLLTELLESHDGDNLAHALSYNGFTK